MAQYIYHQKLHPSKRAEFRRIFAERIRRFERIAAATTPLARAKKLPPTAVVAFFGTTNADNRLGQGVVVVIDFRKPPDKPANAAQLEKIIREAKRVVVVPPTTAEQRAILINPGAPSVTTIQRHWRGHRDRRVAAKKVAKREKNKKKKARKKKKKIARQKEADAERQLRQAAALRKAQQLRDDVQRTNQRLNQDRQDREVAEFERTLQGHGQVQWRGGGRRKTKRRRRRKRRKTRRKRRRRRRRTRKR